MAHTRILRTIFDLSALVAANRHWPSYQRLSPWWQLKHGFAIPCRRRLADGKIWSRCGRIRDVHAPCKLIDSHHPPLSDRVLGQIIGRTFTGYASAVSNPRIRAKSETAREKRLYLFDISIIKPKRGQDIFSQCRQAIRTYFVNLLGNGWGKW